MRGQHANIVRNLEAVEHFPRLENDREIAWAAG